MGSMERNHYEALSAELILLILLEVPNLGSLHSLIRASPKSYQIFLTAKETILVSLIRRSIQSAAFIDALAAVQASQLGDTGPDRKTVLAFLRRYENKRHKAADNKGQHYSIKTAVSLCQLYRATEYFIEDLTSRSNFYLHRCQNLSLPLSSGCDSTGSLWNSHGDLYLDRNNHYTAMSDTEEVRLQRAFYRYELYTQIFGAGMEYDGKSLWELPSDSHFFLERYLHFEIEELACVDNYLWSLLSNAFDRIDHSFIGIQFPMLLNGSERPKSPSYFRSVALHEAKYGIYSLYVDYLLSLSLSFIHHALRLDRSSMQREILSHFRYDDRRRSLSTALEALWKGISLQERSAIDSYIRVVAAGNQIRFNDTVNGPNEGWLCVYSNTAFISPYRSRNTIHSLGYVFWDSQRLRYFGFSGSQYVEELNTTLCSEADVLLQTGQH